LKAPTPSLTEGLVPDGDTQVRALSADTADIGEVAIAVQMVAMPTPEDTGPRESPAKASAAKASPQIPLPLQPDDVPAPERASGGANRPSPACEPDHTPPHATRERRLEAVTSQRNEVHAAPPTGKVILHMAPEAPPKAESTLERPDGTPATPVRPQDAGVRETRQEGARTAPVRDMKFEVSGGERRVEVRLSERSGEVKMTVRTPDVHLASALRENLPALSSRLAENGFKSDAWHPAASSTNELRHTAESSAGGASQDAHTPNREQNRDSQDGAGQGRPKSPQELLPQQQKGKDFAWLMSSLR
jgi:hypothetical protein